MAQRLIVLPWDSQPQELAPVDPTHPLGQALDLAWIGNDLGGFDVLKSHRVALTANTAISRTTRGNAYSHTGTTSSTAAFPAEVGLPYVQIGYGYFNTAGGAWELSGLRAAAGGYLSRLALASSTTVTADVRWNFGTQRTLTITLPTTLNTPICMALVAYSSTDYRFFANGQQQNGTLSPGTFGSLDRMAPPGDTINGGVWLTGFGSGVAVSDADMLDITANPEARLWGMFQRRIWVPVTTSAGSFTATGALAADAATLAGTASHLTLHASSGALSAQAATVAGSASHLTLHTSTGALSADAATVAGSASLASAGSFSATGALSSDAATLSGTAVHYTLHTATGAIAADAATLAGTATHLTLHTATGDLAAGSATVAGVAVHSGPGAVEDTRPQGAGRPRRQVRRVVVEIDGEDFIVNSEEEAIALLDKAKEEAEEVAKVQIQRAAKAAERKPRKVITDARKTLVLPEIKAPGLEEYVSQVLSEIQDSYSSAMRTIEVAALLRKRDRDEEDDEEVLMLML